MKRSKVSFLVSATELHHPTALTDGSKKPTQNPKNLFHGPDPDGSFRVILNGKKAKIYGVASERITHTKADGTRVKKLRMFGATHGYVPSKHDDVSIIAVCPKTEVQYRLVGHVKYCAKVAAKSMQVNFGQQASIATVNAITDGKDKSEVNLNETFDQKVSVASTAFQVMTQMASRPQAKDFAPLEGKKQIESQSVAFKRKLEIIMAQRAAQLDPDLRMSFIPAFLGESKASLYRKMGKEFPMPIKRGKSSFWPMSQIEAYKAGQLVGVSV